MIAGTKFLKLYEGIRGEIGSINVAKSYVDGLVELPIDTLVVNLTRQDVEGNDFGAEEVLRSRRRNFLIFLLVKNAR